MTVAICQFQIWLVTSTGLGHHDNMETGSVHGLKNMWVGDLQQEKLLAIAGEQVTSQVQNEDAIIEPIS